MSLVKGIRPPMRIACFCWCSEKPASRAASVHPKFLTVTNFCWPASGRIYLLQEFPGSPKRPSLNASSPMQSSSFSRSRTPKT